MSELSKADVREKLEAAGVKIRRNANGTEQLFGPGDPGHSNHFHVAWSGSASPETAERHEQSAENAAKAAADRKRRDDDAFTQDIDGARAEQARLAREGVTDLQQLATIDKAAIDAALAKQIDANKRDQAEHRWADAQRAQIDALARAKLNGVIARFGQDGLRIAPAGNPVIDGGSQAGSALTLRGLTPGTVLKLGQFFSLVHNGRRYLHMVAANAVADGAGRVSIAIAPMLRVIVGDGETVEIAHPLIQGSLSGNEVTWTRMTAPWADFGTITITEDE